MVFDGSDQDGVDETYPYPAHPADDYSETKAIAEQFVLAANGQKQLSTCSLRVAGLFGYVCGVDLSTVHDPEFDRPYLVLAIASRSPNG